MSCNLIDKTFKQGKASVTTQDGTPSLLFGKLYDLYQKDGKKAYEAYLITQQEDYKAWFKPSASGSNIDVNGEPEIFKNFYVSIDPVTKASKRWYAFDSNIKSATALYPIGITRIVGMSPEEIKEAVDVLSAAFVNNKIYTVQDFDDIKNLDLRFFGLWFVRHKKAIAKMPNIPEKTKNLYERIFDDLIHYRDDAIYSRHDATPMIDEEGIPLVRYTKNDPDNSSQLLEMVLHRMERETGIELNEDDRKTTLNITPEHFKNPKEKMTANVKLMIRSLNKVKWDEDIDGNPTIKIENSKNLGKPVLVNLTKTYATLMQYLSNIHSSDPNVDVFTLMMDKLKELSPYHAEFVQLVNGLNKAPQYKRTQFVQAFMRPLLDYTSTFVDETSRNGTRIGNPDVQSSEKNIRDNWQINYENAITKTNVLGRRILNVDKAVRAVQAYTTFNTQLKQVYKDSLRKAKKKNIADLLSSEINLNKIAKDFTNLLKTIGIEVDVKAMEYLFKNSQNPALEPNNQLSNLKYVFLGSTRKGSLGLQNLITAHNKTQKGKSYPVLEDKEGNVNSVLFDEKSIVPLSTAQGVYDADLLETTVLGPGATLYWKYGMYSYLHTAVLRIQKGDKSYVEALKSLPYTSQSIWVNWLLENEDNTLKLKQFLHMVNTSTASEGKKNTHLTGADALINNITRILQGQHTTIATGVSSTQYFIQGPPILDSGVEYLNGEVTFSNSTILDTFKRYIAADIETQRQAWEHVFGNERLPADELLLDYHYKLDKTTGDRVYVDTKTKLPVGNVFKGETMMFPEIAFGTELSAELGLYRKDNMPLTVTAETLSNPQIEEMIKKAFVKEFKKSLALAIKYDVFFESKEGVLINKAIDSKLIDTFKNKRDKDGNVLNSQISARAFGDYIFNSIISARESVGMFVGHPAMYKNIEEMPKRSNHFTTPTQRFRIYKDKGKWAINPKYLHATVADMFTPGEFFTDPKWRKVLGNKIADMFENVDLADGTTWITPELFKQRELGLGRWPAARAEAFGRIMAGKAKRSDYSKVNFTPQKFTVRGTNIVGQYNVPRIEKTAYVVLWPDLVKSTPLQGLYDVMVAKELDNFMETSEMLGVQVGVISAVKAGTTTVDKINTEGKLDTDFELSFSLQEHSMMGLAQEVGTKGFKQTIVGSQPKQIILSNIDLEATYPGYNTGSELLRDYYDTEERISELGRTRFAKQHGLSEDLDTAGVIDRLDFHRALMGRYKDSDNVNMLEALEDGEIPLDAMFQDRRGLQSALTNSLSSAAILYKALGGQFVQISGFGLGQDPSRYSKLKNDVTNRIKWLIDTPNLRPATIDMENKKIIPHQILLPYSFIEKIKIAKGVDNLTDKELREYLTPEALHIIGYRIPNQSIASISTMQVAGILPKGSGDTIVVFDGITGLTGSDFDIDKIFLLLPHLTFDTETQKLKRVDSNLNSKEGLENRRIKIWESILQNASNSKELLYPTDTGFLKDDADAVYEMASVGTDEKKMDNLKFFSPVHQDGLKTRFLMGQQMVGSVANNIVDHIPSILAGLQLTQYIGYGHKGLGKDENVYTDLSQNTVIGDSMLITQVISAYLNANVDIEKDPYISYVNFNTHTVNVAFLLLRSGVSYKWVNRFLAQPVLREYIETLFATDSESLQDKKLSKSAIERKALNKTKKSFFPKTTVIKDQEETTEEIEENKIETIYRYSVSIVAANPNKIYVFGDNILEEGKGGQAIIRDEENAFGIPTKVSPNRTAAAYFTDVKFDSNISQIDRAISKIKKDGRVVVFPSDGLGKDRANLEEEAPETYKYLKQRLLEEFGFDNDTGKIIKSSSETSYTTESGREVKIVYTTEGKVRKDGLTQDIVPAYTSYDENGNGTIVINKEALAQKYKEKAWTNPKVQGVTALPEDAFTSYNEWETFVIGHEAGHVEEGPSVEERGTPEYASMENRMNRLGLDAVEVLRNEMGEDEEIVLVEGAEIPEGLQAADILTIPVLENLLTFKEGEPEYFEMQKLILDEFLRLAKHGDAVLEQMLGSRIVSTGLGRNLTEVRFKKEKKESLDKDTRFINFESKYSNNNGSTLIGSAHKNVDYILETFEDEFLSESPFMVEGLHSLLSSVSTNDDVLLRQKFVDTMYSYVYSGFIRVASTEEFSMKNLLFSKSEKDSFVVEFRRMQKERPDSILLNKILTSKLNAFGQNKIPSYVKSRGLKGVPQEIQNLATKEWEELYINPTTRKFAIKLVNMAYFVSGFNRNQNSFHTLIPMTWNKSSGFSEYVRHDLADLNPLFINNMVEQILRHETDNPRFVPDFSVAKAKIKSGVKNSGYKNEKGKFVPFSKNISITLKGKAKDYVKRTTSKGKIIYAPVIKNTVMGEMETIITGYRVDGTPIYTRGRLSKELVYKLIGLQYSTVDGQKIKNPVYEVVSPLGYKDSRGNKIAEFRFDPDEYGEKGNYSIFEQNDPKVEVKQYQLKSYIDFKATLRLIATITAEKNISKNSDREIC